MTPELVAQSGHVLAGAVLAIAVLTAYRWVRRESPIVAGVMAFGILARAAIGLVLFWISYLDASFLRGLHTGDGFWALAPDAGTYYYAAIRAYFDGMSAIPAGTPSPGFVQMLAGWMQLVGPSPASALFLNLCLFVLLCVLVIKICRPAANRQAQLSCAACLAPFSIAPALLIHGSQPLKDEVFVFLITIACLSVLTLLRVQRDALPHPMPLRMMAAALSGLGLAAYAIAGIRLYYAAIVLLCLAAASLIAVWRARTRYLGRTAATAAVCLTVAAAGPAWVYTQLGAAPLSTPQSSVPLTAPGAATTPLVWMNGLSYGRAAFEQLRNARYRFVKSGGASNVVREPGVQAPVVRSTLVGLALILVPVSIVKAMGLADFPGGRGLLVVTDIDTVLLDLSILTCVALLFVRRESIAPNAAYVWFVLALAIVTGVLLSFVVTNFGTLFRLRLLMVVPIWMLPLATCYRVEVAVPDRQALEVDRNALMPQWRSA